ncbi:MAG: hypothetical protein Q7V62_03730, partial [Actinomycetota bacterium]|nr:hypothetical protein [Actinomycetota bacterium]
MSTSPPLPVVVEEETKEQLEDDVAPAIGSAQHTRDVRRNGLRTLREKKFSGAQAVLVADTLDARKRDFKDWQESIRDLPNDDVKARRAAAKAYETQRTLTTKRAELAMHAAT